MTESTNVRRLYDAGGDAEYTFEVDLTRVRCTTGVILHDKFVLLNQGETVVISDQGFRAESASRGSRMRRWIRDSFRGARHD